MQPSDFTTTSLRFFVNFFQPSFKLADKVRNGTMVKERYDTPVTPHQRMSKVNVPRSGVIRSCRVTLATRPSRGSSSWMRHWKGCGYR
jgi:hypothetical protein